MNKFKTIFIIIGIVVAFLLGKECSTNTLQKENKIHDTIFKIDIDTIYQDTGSIKFKDRPYPVAYKVYDNVDLDTDMVDAMLKTRFYNEVYRDSSVEITVKDSILGYLLNQSISYKLLGIKQINTSKTIIIPQPTPLKYQFSMGIQASPQGLAALGELTVNKNQYGIGYDPFNKIPYIQYKRVLFRK